MMLKAVSELTAKYKIPSQLSLERYMKCGYGICGNCGWIHWVSAFVPKDPSSKNDVCEDRRVREVSPGCAWEKNIRFEIPIQPHRLLACGGSSRQIVTLLMRVLDNHPSIR